MNAHQPQLQQPEWESPYYIPSEQRPALLKGFWVITLGVLGFIFLQDAPLESTFGALLIAIAALFPGYLWCSGVAKGIPIFPVLALTFLWTHALPLVSNHPQVITYTPSEHLHSAMIVVAFLAVGTLFWQFWVKSYPQPPAVYRRLRVEQGDRLFFWLLGLSILYQVAFNAGWLWLLVGSGGKLAILRGFTLGLNALGVFALAYRAGRKELSQNQARLFAGLLTVYLLVTATSLYLIGVFTTSLLAAIGFTVGRRQFPWKAMLIVVIIGGLLHLGKPEMRAKYWFDEQAAPITPWQYPTYYAEWVNFSLNQIGQADSNLLEPQPTEDTLALTDRSSLMHLLLLVQKSSPEYVPYLNGQTYTIIPQLLVPRLLNPNKLRGSEGNHILSVRYGLQTYEATFTTSIGWGLLQEAYANFGMLGCLGLGAILGSLCGLITRWCLQTSLFSFRSLFAVIITNAAFQTEWTAGTLVSATFQATVVLLAVNFLLMKPHVHESYSEASNALSNDDHRQQMYYR